MKNKINKGFTLIEVLVVLGIMVFVSAIVSGIYFASLRTATKVNTLTVVRQNGDYAIAQIIKTVRFASGFAGVSNNNITYTTDCTATGSNQYNFLRITTSTGIDTTYSCVGPGPAITETTAASTVSLINTGTVVLSSCSFTCTQITVTAPPDIGLSFSLSSKTTSNLPENNATIPFQTSVSLRNFGQ